MFPREEDDFNDFVKGSYPRRDNRAIMLSYAKGRKTN